jgi:hypothetical protein
MLLHQAASEIMGPDREHPYGFFNLDFSFASYIEEQTQKEFEESCVNEETEPLCDLSSE